MRSFLAAAGLYFGSLTLLRFEQSDFMSGDGMHLWIGYFALVAAGIFIAEILRHFRDSMPRNLRAPALGLLALAAFGLYQFGPGILRSTGLTMPMAAVATGTGETALRPGWDGHYRTYALIGGQKVGFLVDTGASLVLLRHEDALRAGIDVAKLDFSLPVTTASGEARVAPIRLDSLTIDGLGVANVRAAVAMPGMLHTSLLGMSFLENLSETIIRRDVMILRN